MPCRAMSALVTRCERAEPDRHSGGFAPGSASPSTDPGPCRFRESSCVLLLLPLHMSEFMCPSNRSARGPCGDDNIPISSPIRRPPPPLRPPLCLLSEPRRAMVIRVTIAHYEEVGGFPIISPDIASSSDSRSRAATSERHLTHNW